MGVQEMFDTVDGDDNEEETLPVRKKRKAQSAASKSATGKQGKRSRSTDPHLVPPSWLFEGVAASARHYAVPQRVIRAELRKRWQNIIANAVEAADVPTAKIVAYEIAAARLTEEPAAKAKAKAK